MCIAGTRLFWLAIGGGQGTARPTNLGSRMAWAICMTEGECHVILHLWPSPYLRRCASRSRRRSVHVISPALGYFAGEPEQGQAEDAAGGVHHHIGYEGGAAGDDDLMKFVSGRVGEDDGESETGFIPAPGASVTCLRLADGAPGEQGEQGIFRQVAAFAEEMMELADVLFGHVREEPAHDGLKNQGGMVLSLIH